MVRLGPCPVRPTLQQPLRASRELRVIGKPDRCPVILEMARACGEERHVACERPILFLDGRLPRFLGIVMLGVLGVIGPRRERDLRQGFVLHRVEEDGGQIPLRQRVHRAEGELRLHVVVDGVIPPDAEFAPVERLRPGKRLVRQRPLGHAIPRVEHEDVGRKSLRERVRIGLAHPVRLHVRIEVLRRHRQEAADIIMALLELARDITQKSRLSRAVLVLDIIKEDGEVAHAERVERLELCDHLLAVGIALVAVQRDIESRRYGKDEAHILRLRRLDERTELRELLRRIRLTPLLAVIRIILRRVEVSVVAFCATE